MAEGERLFARGRYEQAADRFRRAVQALPQRPEAWVNLGVALVEQQQCGAALPVLERALELAPGFAPAHLARADALRGLGQLDPAIEAYRRAIALQPFAPALNKLGCLLRVLRSSEEAESCYRKALDLAPNYATARVNLATLQIDRGRFELARTQLQALLAGTLPPQERAEAAAAFSLLREYQRLEKAVGAAVGSGALEPLHELLRQTDGEFLTADQACMDQLRAVATSVQGGSDAAAEPPRFPELGPEWPMLEAHFSLVLGDRLEDYLRTRSGLQAVASAGTAVVPESNLSSVQNVAAAIVASRRGAPDLSDPITAELHLRYWHGLITRDQRDSLPGQFKIQGNQVLGSLEITRANPLHVPGTVRQFFGDIYPGVTPGMTRAALVFYAVSKVHAFSDGNGRLAGLLMNRELENAGQAPFVFPSGLGGAMSQALGEVHRHHDLEPLLQVFGQAQAFTRAFCAALREAA
ncbi:MAG: tetratricopeptide repeat protein [Gammaproteobacteria bacterium]|nr:tetratricopeptide repeat protein [Gammaproteobacteria bacterium]